jgi:hypothetical protein
VEKALRALLFDEGWVDYAVTEVTSGPARESAGLFDRGGQREKVEARPTGGYTGSVLVQKRGTVAFPVDVDLVREDGTTERVHLPGTETVRVPYSGAQALKGAVVDPEHRVLLDEVPTNDFGLATHEARSGAPRTFERLLYWVDLAIQTVLP